MRNVIETLLAEGAIVSDGAWGTQLQARGLPLGACPDAWNIDYAERVEEVARAYVEAGSRVILTNTFGASRIALERHGLAAQTVAINRAGVEISRRAARRAPHAACGVFASIGPTGRMLAAGDVSLGELWSAFAEQADALAEAGADALVIETMSDLQEAKLAVRTSVRTGLPVVACMVFDAGKFGDRTMMGQTPEQAAQELEDAGASAIGSNCGRGAEQMLPICRRLKDATALPIWMKPNAGMPELVDGKAVYTATPEKFVQDVIALVEAGASFVGGCCGTSPAFIRGLASRLEDANHAGQINAICAIARPIHEPSVPAHL